jgi:prolyl-tRNA synthetase
MKDSYSFDLDDAGLAAPYCVHRAAYTRAFARMGLETVVVSAVSGAMGGSHSEEFLAPAHAGEDTFVSCPACGHAANAEAAELKPADRPGGSAGHSAMEELDTPDTPTIEALVERLAGRVSAAQALKILLVKVAGRPVAVGVPGDRDVDLARLEAAVTPDPVHPFSAEDFAERPGLPRGYVGPQGLAELGVAFYADPLVAPGTAWVTGANREGHHMANAVCGRDFTVDRYLPAATVRAGDPCPSCGGPLHVGRGIEVDHIFELGRKYTDAFGFDVAGPDGNPTRVTMGSYGLGVSRVVAAVAEQTADDAGLRWPASLAPFDVHIVPVGRSAEHSSAAEDLADQLDARGADVILDDRGTAPGVAFADADLLGTPRFSSWAGPSPTGQSS